MDIHKVHEFYEEVEKKIKDIVMEIFPDVSVEKLKIQWNNDATSPNLEYNIFLSGSFIFYADDLRLLEQQLENELKPIYRHKYETLSTGGIRCFNRIRNPFHPSNKK